MKVLHFSEAFGGGITSAVASYISASPQHDHYVTGFLRKNDTTGEELEFPSSKTAFFPRSVKGLIGLLKHIHHLKSDVLHLHSSYAGAIGRIPLVAPRKSVIVYTPHGYAFLRNDNISRRFFYQLFEAIFSLNTNRLAACSRDELEISKKFFPPEKLFELINISTTPIHPLNQRGTLEDSGKVFTVGMVGRVCAQKGADFFAEVAAIVGNRIKMIWIGGGDPSLCKQLEASGVHVTGWLTRQQVVEQVEQLDLYFHSAAWDGFPISVLEAANCGRPIVLRAIRPFILENLYCLQTPTEVAKELTSYQSHADEWPSAINCLAIRNHHNIDSLALRLAQLYDSASV